MSNITVDCAVCGKHKVSVPARPGTYRVKCPNAKELDLKYSYSATVVKVYEDGSVSSRQGSPS
jgi:phage FluMu protein Com